MAARLFRISLFIYWVAFALLTAYRGQFPSGFAPNPELWRYPYVDVVLVCALLALKLLILYLILPAARFPWSWRRVVAALIYSGLLLSSGSPTDMPPYYYVADTFALTTFCGVLVLSLGSIGFAIRQRAERAA